MSYRIKNHFRLGDIVRNAPIFIAAAAQHGDVVVEVLPEYLGIAEVMPFSFKFETPSGGKCDLDLDVWPSRYQDYFDSPLSLTEYIYDLAAKKGIHTDVRRPLLCIEATTRSIEGRYRLVSPFCISQVEKRDPRKIVENYFPPHQTISTRVLVPPGADYQGPGKPYTATGIADLCGVIADAQELLTVNSAPSVIAHALRDEYHAIHDPSTRGKDHYYAPNQKTLYLS